MPSSEPWSAFQPVVLGLPELASTGMLVKNTQPNLHDAARFFFQLKKNTQPTSTE